jgi:hypothetical protein
MLRTSAAAGGRSTRERSLQATTAHRGDEHSTTARGVAGVRQRWQQRHPRCVARAAHRAREFSSATASGDTNGVYGESASTDGQGVYGRATAASGFAYGLYGESASTSGRGVYGLATATSGSAIGVYGVTGSSSGYAGYFVGSGGGAGRLTKSSGSFKIDHPLDPANQYLYHSFVESPDMKNIYDGVVTLDARGEAMVTLPDWFEALNQRLSLPVDPNRRGDARPVHRRRKMRDNAFRIAGGAPGMKVSWQVTGIRHDAYANAHRIPVEEPKPADEQRPLPAPRSSWASRPSWGWATRKTSAGRADRSDGAADAHSQTAILTTTFRSGAGSSTARPGMCASSGHRSMKAPLGTGASAPASPDNSMKSFSAS